MNRHIQIGKHRIGPGEPVYIVAEISANHNGSLDHAAAIIRAACEAGANAVKLQTYTPDTLTLSCARDAFKIGPGTVWEGRNLYELYAEAFMPWEWQPQLRQIAGELGIELFSTPFDNTAVDFLEEMGVPAYKIASFELVDFPLIEYVARTGKPVILSTGMADREEIAEALQVFTRAGGKDMALLKCTSSYPALPQEMNLRMISTLSEEFGVAVGISDHSLELAVPVAAVALGACIVEKHITLSRSVPGPDSSFSLEPQEFRTMVNAVRVAEEALGEGDYCLGEGEMASRIFRRSLFVVEEMEQGDAFTERNVRSIRPGNGLHTRFLQDVLGKHSSRKIERGTPLHWDLIAD